MVQWQTKGKRKPTGGIRRSISARHKKLSEKGGVVADTKIGADKRVTLSTMGKTPKVKLLQSREANVVSEKGGITKAEIITVKGNSANKLFVRRNIMTKGAVIAVKHAAETRLARVTNRPGQSGTIEAVLLAPEEAKQFEKQRAPETAKVPQKDGETAKNAKEDAKPDK